MADDVSKSLLRFALRNSGLENTAIDSSDIENENVRNIAKLSISKDKQMAIAGQKLLKIMAESENNQTAKNLLEFKEDLFIKNSKTNSKNASLDRKAKPSKTQLLELKDKWVENHAKENGWKKLAKNTFNISYQTINLILKEV